jgi:hypothetical protein
MLHLLTNSYKQEETHSQSTLSLSQFNINSIFKSIIEGG